MKRYIKSSEYFDEYSETTIKTDGEVYGYEVWSTMTDITIMFCHKDEDYLLKHIKKIYELLTMEDADGEYEAYCNEVGINIVDDEYGDLDYIKLGTTVEDDGNGGLNWTDDDAVWVAEINGSLYDVTVIAKDSARI